jgi:hypothetical protein
MAGGTIALFNRFVKIPRSTDPCVALCGPAGDFGGLRAGAGKRHKKENYNELHNIITVGTICLDSPSPSSVNNYYNAAILNSRIFGKNRRLHRGREIHINYAFCQKTSHPWPALTNKRTTFTVALLFAGRAYGSCYGLLKGNAQDRDADP